HELSGGMQQRVGIARALMRKPILIFMDEPFGALDAQTREQLQEDFLAIWSRTGATVIFVTHSIDEPLILSDRIFVFHTAPGSIRRSRARGWAATSAPIPIWENAAPNCGRCSGASHEFVTGNAAAPVGPRAAADMGATPARGCRKPQRHSHRLGRGLLRG